MAEGYFSDVYVLANDRSVSFVQQFLEKFMPFHKASSNEYQIPEYAEDPQLVFQNALDLMQYCEQNKKESNRIYWHNVKEDEPRHAMVFYTRDGMCILGLSVNDEKSEDEFLSDLKTFANSQFGYIAYETPPEETREEFIALIKSLEKT